MKLAEWSLHVYRLPYVRDIQWVYAAESSGDYALLKIVADNGAIGIAEGVIKPTRTGYSPRSLHGVRALKIQGGQGRDTDLRTIAAVRAAVGKDVELYVDANGSYTREEALGYVRALADAGVSVAEDPCPLAPDAAYAALQRD